MTKISLLAGAILFLSVSAPLQAAETLPWDTVAVTFKEPVGDRFVSVLHLVMGTETIRKQSPTSYTFRIGRRGNQNDYAVFFAHLPYVQGVQPLPKLSAAERELPDVLLHLPLDVPDGPVERQGVPTPAAAASGDPVPSDNAGPGIYLSPQRLLGSHLLVRYRAGGPTPALIDQVYGTRPLERTDADEVRLALPPSMTPQVAARIFRLCPWVSQAEPAYGR